MNLAERRKKGRNDGEDVRSTEKGRVDVVEWLGNVLVGRKEGEMAIGN